jgi:hypothetical protein
MFLKQTIEQFDPGHFDRRKDILEDLREKVRELGFFPLPLTQNDIECLQLVFEDNRGKKYRGTSITVENLEDVLENPDCHFMKTMKYVLRYEPTK